MNGGLVVKATLFESEDGAGLETNFSA